MPNKKGQAKRPPLPVLHLDKLLKPKKAERQNTSTASSTDYIMGGITMTSAVELPFDIDDPSRDPIFSQGPEITRASEKPTLTPQESASGGKKKEARGNSDMDISDDEKTSSTESEDSSVDIPVRREKPAASCPINEMPQNPQNATLSSSQREEEATKEVEATMAAKENAAPANPSGTAPSESSQVERETANKGNDPMEVESTENIPQQIFIGQQTHNEDMPRPSSRTSAADEKSKVPAKLPSGAAAPSKVPATGWKGKDSTNRPLGAPSRKRSRDEANAANSTAAESERATSEQRRSTPPLGETPRPRFYDEEERQLFDKIDRMILDDEWEELKNKIDRDILAAEEEDLLKRIDQASSLFQCSVVNDVRFIVFFFPPALLMLLTQTFRFGPIVHSCGRRGFETWRPRALHCTRNARRIAQGDISAKNRRSAPPRRRTG